MIYVSAHISKVKMTVVLCIYDIELDEYLVILYNLYERLSAFLRDKPAHTNTSDICEHTGK